MPVYINKDGQQSGPYEDNVVIDQLRSGMLSPNDMAIRHGDSSWQRLGDLFPGLADQARATPPIPIPPAPPAAGLSRARLVISPRRIRSGSTNSIGISRRPRVISNTTGSGLWRWSSTRRQRGMRSPTGTALTIRLATT